MPILTRNIRVIKLDKTFADSRLLYRHLSWNSGTSNRQKVWRNFSSKKIRWFSLPYIIETETALQMKDRWESNINIWFLFMYSQKWNCYFQNRIILFCFPVPTLFERFIYFQDRSAYFAAGKYVDRSWEYVNHSQTHECGNWNWGRTIPGKGIHKCDFPCSATSKSHVVLKGKNGDIWNR